MPYVGNYTLANHKEAEVAYSECRGDKEKKMHKGRAGDALAGSVRPLFVHDEVDRLVHCSPLPTLLEKMGNTLVLSHSRDIEQQRLQRRQWKVHISWRYSHSSCLFCFNKVFFLVTASMETNIADPSEILCRSLPTTETAETFFQKRRYRGGNWSVTPHT